MATIPRPVHTEHRFSVRVDYFSALKDARVYATAVTARDGYRCDVATTPAPRSEADTPYAADQNRNVAGRYGVTVHDRPGEGWYG